MTKNIILSKGRAFMLLFCVLILLGLCWQSIWIFSRVTPARMIPFIHYDKYPPNDNGRIQAVYYVKARAYFQVYIRKSFISKDSSFMVRYLSFAPYMSRPDTLLGNWGYLFLFWLISLLILLIIFLRPDIIRKNDVIIIQHQRPYFKMLRGA